MSTKTTEHPRYTVWVTGPGGASKEFLAQMETFVSSYHPYVWPARVLAESWVLDLEVTGNPETSVSEIVGYTWFHREFQEIWSAHGVIHPDHQRRWASRRTLDSLRHLIEVSGMTACLAYCPTPHVASIWQRLGFQYLENAHLAIYDTTKDNNNGIPETQHPGSRTTAASPGTPG